MSTVEQAVRTLSFARAWLPADSAVGYAWSAQLRMSKPLAHDQLRRAHRLLGAYRTPLSEAGIDYDEIAVPDGNTTDPTVGADHRPTAAAPLEPGPHTRSKAWIGADGKLWVKNPFELRAVVGAIPGALFRKHVPAWEIPATPMAALNVDGALRRTGLVTNGAFDELLAVGQRGLLAQQHRTATVLEPMPGRTPGWIHQLQAYHFGRELQAFCMDIGMGGGKSRIAVGLFEDWQPRRAMIVCPERVVGVWPKQFRLHAASEWHVVDPRRQKRTGEWELLPVAKRVELYDHALHDCDCGLGHVILSNFAAAGVPAFADWTARQRFDVISYDEVHRLRSHSGVWSEWATKMVKRSERRIGGTGTLMAQTPEDVFGVFRALDPGIFGTSFTKFRRRHSITRPLPGGGTDLFKELNPEHEAEFVAKAASITYRVGEEALDLPEMIDLPHAETTLAPATMRAYREFEVEMVVELQRLLESGMTMTEVLSVDNPLTKRLRLLQMAGGTITADSGEVLHVDPAKEKLLADLLSDLPEREPVVVFCKFRPDLDAVQRVADKLRRPYRELSGRRSDALSGEATLHPDAVIAGVQLQAGGVGIDLTRAAYGVYFSTGDSLSDYLQSRKRLHRPGQTRPVRFRHLVVAGTVEEKVYEALAARESVATYYAAWIKRVQEGKS